MVPNRAKHHIFENRDTKAMNIDILNLYFEHLLSNFPGQSHGTIYDKTSQMLFTLNFDRNL